MNSPYRPTGSVLPGGKVEVVDPNAPGGALSRPFGVNPDELRATRDQAFAAANPHLDPRRPYPTNEVGYRMGQGMGNFWRKAQSQPWSSDLIGAGAGALGATGLTYLLDTLGYKFFDKRPMSGKARLLSALAGAAGGAGINHWMRNSVKTSSAWSADAAQMTMLRQQLAARVMTSQLPYDLKSQVLRMLDRASGRDLSELARMVAPLAGSVVGVAIARFFFGNSFIPEVAGGMLGFAAGRSAFSPRVNAMGMQML
jgi:hypothetical protein